MKRLFTLMITLLLLFTSVTAIAAGSKSPTVSDLYKWIPAYTVKEMKPLPTMADVAFAKTTLERFLGKNYEMVDAFNINIAYPYSIVKYTTPYFSMNNKFLMILTNAKHTYFLTPIIIQDTGIFDFTNVAPAWYACYILWAKK